MTTINMKDFYYWYIVDELVEVPDEVAEVLLASRRNEAAYQRRLTRTRRFIPWTAMTGSNTPRVCTSPAPRSSWIGKKCFSVCGTPSTPCRKSRAAGWTLT